MQQQMMMQQHMMQQQQMMQQQHMMQQQQQQYFQQPTGLMTPGGGMGMGMGMGMGGQPLDLGSMDSPSSGHSTPSAAARNSVMIDGRARAEPAFNFVQDHIQNLKGTVNK